MTLTQTDIPAKSWLWTALPSSLHPYAKLARWDRPVGIWLLLLPCLWSVLLAAGGMDGLTMFHLKTAAFFFLGSVIMRGAGCTINDILDRDIDIRVARTANRPLACGQITLKPALFFLVLQLLLGLAVLMQMNRPTLGLGFAALPLVFLYPLMKRITWWPQLFLGLTFNWGALMGWTAIDGELQSPALLLYLAGIFWTLGYDTIYAYQDRADDLLTGIKSTALRFGKHSRKWISVFYAAFLALVLMAGFQAHAGIFFYPALLLPAIHLIFIIKSFDENNPAFCLRQFKNNVITGLFVLSALALG